MSKGKHQRSGEPGRRTEKIGVEVAAKLIQAAGFAYSCVRGGKHLKVVITTPAGRQQTVTICGTPRVDDKGLANFVRQQTNRAIRILQTAAV